VSWPVACTPKAWFGPQSVPVGRFTLLSARAFCTSSMPMPSVAMAVGSSCTRTAYFCEPKIPTCATPVIVEMRCARLVWAYSSTM
jgi:hypothetical protein